jgi:hypothetical protein
LIAASVVLIAIIAVASLTYVGVIPLFPKSGEQLAHPETAWIAGLETANGTLIANGQNTADKVLTIKGNVTNPPIPAAKTSGLLSASATHGSGCQLLSAGLVNDQVTPVADRVFNGRVMLALNNSQRYLSVQPLEGTGGVDLWEFEGSVVLAPGTNTFMINVLDLNNATVGQSRTFKVVANIPSMDIRITLTWDTNSSDMDLHVWHFPYISLPAGVGGMDGNAGWWQLFGHWSGVPEQSEWVSDIPTPDAFNYKNIEAMTWFNYSYTYNQQQYTYGDGVAQAWWYNKLGISGAQIDVDCVTGYGPEVFTMGNARPGLYTVVLRMYSPHDCNTTTNANVMVELFGQVKGTFSHAFPPYAHYDNVVQYQPGWDANESSFDAQTQATVTDWVAYSFYILPDKTVTAPVEKDIAFSADCLVSAAGPSYFRDRWFMLDHATSITSLISSWTSSGWGMLTLNRLGEGEGSQYSEELVMTIEKETVGVRPGGIWQGVTGNIPPGLYSLSAGNGVEGPNTVNINAKIMSSP